MPEPLSAFPIPFPFLWISAVGDVSAATFAMDVEGGATVTYTWQTDILKSSSGLEQRVAMLAKPRQRYEFSSVLSDSQQRRILSTLAGTAHQGSLFSLGMAFESLSVVSSTATTIVTHGLTYCDWDEPGQSVVVVSPTGVTGEAVIQSSAGSTLTVDTNLTTIALVGARVMPTMSIYLDADQSMPRHNVNIGRWDLKARAQRFRYGTAGVVGAGATVVTHDAIPVWTRGIQTDGVASQSLRSGSVLVDLGARISAMQAYDRADWGRTFRIEAHRMADWQWFKKFLDTINGRRVAFLLPTGRPDLVPIGDASTGLLTVDATNTDYLGDWFPSLAHRRLQLVKTDGTVAYRTVSTVEDLGATQRLTLSSALTGALARVEFLETCRLESDEISVGWQGHVFAAELAARVVQR